MNEQRFAELEEEFYEEWHPAHGTNMTDMLVNKIVVLEIALQKLVNAADMIAEDDPKQQIGSVSIPWGYVNNQRYALRRSKS